MFDVLLETPQVGGASNFAIAAARLGMDSSCLGHLGQDGYGEYPGFSTLLQWMYCLCLFVANEYAGPSIL